MLVLKHYDDYNTRRYGAPWVCKMTDRGVHDFGESIGTYTGDTRQGTEGDLVIFEPIEGQVYGCGQRDYYGNNTKKNYIKIVNGEAVECDKLGRCN